jgi:OOP family OmpA-OmpF porin
MKRVALLLLLPSLLLASPAFADEGDNPNADAEGCKDNALFTRMPGFHIVSCEDSQFEMRRFPVGPPDAANDNKTKGIDVEGPTWFYRYGLNEGVKPASGLQIMRNFQNAAKKAGGSVEAEYPDWCTASYDTDHMPAYLGNGCTDYGTTLKIMQNGKELWAYVAHDGENNGYDIVLSQREAMKQDIAVNEIVDEINKNGFIALYINFDTGKATIKPDSNKTLDDAATALKAAPTLNIEVGGHTDNVGTAESNQKLSEDRAKSVMAALVARGIDAKRLTAKGYGQSKPVADNSTDAGKAKNRRVELTKK